MANTTLTQTGAQVQAILDKADKLPSSLGTAGQVLTMNAGATAPEWQTPSGGGGTQLYLHEISLNNQYVIKLCSTSNTAISDIYDLFDMLHVSGAVAMNAPSSNYDDVDFVYKLGGIAVDDTYELDAMILSTLKYSGGAYNIAYTTLTSVTSVTDTITAL